MFVKVRFLSHFLFLYLIMHNPEPRKQYMVFGQKSHLIQKIDLDIENVHLQKL